MIYVPSNDIKNTVAGQKMLYVKDTMNKSDLDRSSRSVIDAYKAKFDLAENELNTYRKYLFNLLDLAIELKDILVEQLKVYKEQFGLDAPAIEVGLSIPATEKGEEELKEIEKVIEQVEEDLDDLKEYIDELTKCMFACYAGGQGETTCTANCEMNCQGGCLTNCQTSCEVQCQGNCEAQIQDTCQTVTEQTCTAICESYCQTGCQTNVQSSCYESCEQHCQSVCQVYTQDGCRVSCDSGDGGEANCLYYGEASCVFPDEDNSCTTSFESNTDGEGDTCWESCPPAYGACGPDFADCNNSGVCPPSFGSEAGCDENQGCGVCEGICQDCQGGCQECEGTCNATCATGCQSFCDGGCQKICADSCRGCQGGCQDGCIGECQNCQGNPCQTCQGGCQGCQTALISGVCQIVGIGGCQGGCQGGEGVAV